MGIKKEPLKKLPIALGMGTAILSLPLGILSAVFLMMENLLYFLLYLLEIIFITLSTSGKYTKKAEELRAKWLAFKKFLVDYSNLEEAKLTSIYIWEHYFVYAIAMGVSKEVAKGYEKIFKDSEDISRLNRTPIMGMYNRNSGFRDIERTMSKATTRGITELAKSRPSSRGSGGEFIGGSSGGGGSVVGGGGAL